MVNNDLQRGGNEYRRRSGRESGPSVEGRAWRLGGQVNITLLLIQGRSDGHCYAQRLSQDYSYDLLGNAISPRSKVQCRSRQNNIASGPHLRPI